MSARGYRLHPAAAEELDAAGEWYDAQRPGLNLKLLDAVEESIALIIERPAAWQRDSVVAGRELRRFVMRLGCRASVCIIARWHSTTT